MAPHLTEAVFKNGIIIIIIVYCQAKELLINSAEPEKPWWVLSQGGDVGKVHFMKGASDKDVQGGGQQEGMGEGTSQTEVEDRDVVLKALIPMAPEQEYKWRPAHFLPLYLRVIYTTDKLLNKIRSFIWMNTAS